MGDVPAFDSRVAFVKHKNRPGANVFALCIAEASAWHRESPLFDRLENHVRVANTLY